MNFIELLFLGGGLAMDAFAVSICKGLSFKRISLRNAIIVGLYFGAFQALMPLIGYFLGISFADFVTNFDHWIAFFLLLFIGGNMIKECFFGKDEDSNDDLSVKTMLLLAIATSIDALAVGITFAFLKVNLFLAISVIGIVTFILSLLGVFIGFIFGDKFEKKAQLLGGIILIVIGIKILLEHLGVL